MVNGLWQMGQTDFAVTHYGLRIVAPIENTGIDRDALDRYIEEQIYTLPGTDRHREEFSIVLTGSRAIGRHGCSSDVDLDVLCPRPIYQSVHQACFEAGIINSPTAFWYSVKGDDWQRYFGPKQVIRPHFSVIPLDVIQRQFVEYDDVALWIWTNAQLISDPNRQFQTIRETFQGYPRDVLIRKIKHRWLLAWYMGIGGCPRGTGLLMAVSELLKLFFLVEGKPYPYPKSLIRLAPETELGKEFCPMLERVVDLVIGKAEPQLTPEERVDLAYHYLGCEDGGEESQRLEELCARAMIEAGVDPNWVKADYGNLDELLSGSLGPPP